MSLVTLSGIPVLSGRITVPFSGLWHADLTLVQALPIPGPFALTFANSVWTCSAVRNIAFTGKRQVRVVAGLGGWRTTIPAKQYGMGVIPTSLVLADAALACGELPPVVDATINPILGSNWCRPAGPAGDTLMRVLGDSWYASPLGVVQTVPRIGVIVSPFQALEVEGSSGIYEITTNAPNDWIPGWSFIGPTVSGTISRVTYVITPNRLRLEVMVPSNLPSGITGQAVVIPPVSIPNNT
jgi:hypothetical protein